MERNVDIINRVKLLSDSYKDYNIDAYLIPSTDEYLSEYSADYYKRLKYITGFSGSNGYAIIYHNKILFFTDGRYIAQAQKELPENISQICDIKNIQNLELKDLAQNRIGYNPKLFCHSQIKLFEKFNLQQIDEDLVDKIWIEDRPAKPKSQAFIYDIQYSGQTSEEKIFNIQNEMLRLNADYHLITDCSSICWLLNIRGSDIPFCPLLIAKLIISKDKLYLFTDLSKISHLNLKNIILLEEDEIYRFLLNLHGSILLDKNSVPMSYIQGSSHLNIINHTDLCSLPKSCKNNIEIDGSKSAHIKDGISLIEFFAWLEDSLNAKDELTEFDLGKKLTYFRSNQEGYISDSFPSICGFGSNGAIIHYNASQSAAKKIQGDSGLLLIDSGAHYYGGTTDVTRTINIGNPTKEHIKFYTKVLKGHIALLKATFLQSTKGSNLDILARQYLWDIGCDYAHGTGHGVGNALSVHEGPQSLNLINQITLKKNMILSNEPGYYLDGEFGIRIENLMYVNDSEFEGFLKFENLTMVPYCADLIDINMLDKSEKQYLIDFYTKLNIVIFPLLSSRAKNYFTNQTEKLNLFIYA